METHVGKMRLIGQKLEHTEFQKKKKKVRWAGQTVQEFSQESYGISILEFSQNWAEELLINLI